MAVALRDASSAELFGLLEQAREAHAQHIGAAASARRRARRIEAELARRAKGGEQYA